MGSDSKLDEPERLLLTALRCAIRGERVPWTAPLEDRDQASLLRLAQAQVVLPLLAQASYERPEVFSQSFLSILLKNAKQLTLIQAARTGEFLQLYERLAAKGFHPAVMKGLVCRNLYPNPEQRSSTDEDLLVSREELAACHAALVEDGFVPVDPDAKLEETDETAFRDDERDLYVELHLRPFSSKSDAYGSCNRYFEDALSRTEEVEIYGRQVRTLCPSDHLFFLLCHAFKHVLHGGIGIRQLCDICLFAERYRDRIDWLLIQSRCREQRLEKLTNAIFRIGQDHLGIPSPDAFCDTNVDEYPLLLDSLRGGLYGANDLDRLHSSTLTLEAVAANRTKRRSRGVLHSVFLPADSLEGRFPYLRRRPWLLPAAWIQRTWSYLTQEKPKPGSTLRIGRERIEMLKQYDVIS